MFSILRVLLVTSAVALVGSGAIIAQAQPHDPVPDPPSPDEVVSDTADGDWSYDATARLSVSQAAYKDWKEGGGTNTLAITGATGLVAEKRGSTWLQAHEVRLAFGILDQEDQALRKAEDQIRIQSNLRYQGDDFFRVFNPTLAVQLRTQFASGFDYDGNPFKGEVPSDDPRFDQSPPVQTSAFFSPAFITETLGLTYEPVPQFTLRLGAASKQTVVTQEDFRILYGVDPDKLARVEAGVEFASSLDAQLSESIRYRSDLSVFYSVNQTEEPPDVLWDNTLSLAVNSWLTTDIEFTALFDQQTTQAVQLRETISVGLSFTLL